jgi:group I intron endonuclease
MVILVIDTVQIYLIRNTINGKIYIGKTTGTLRRRWFEHMRDARLGKQRYLCQAIRKYGVAAFTIEALHENIASLAELNQLEREMIKMYGSCNSAIGYNLTTGGDGNTMSPEAARRHSEKLKGRFGGANNPFYGKRHDEVTRKYMGDLKRGIPLTPEHVRNRQASLNASGGNLGERHHMFGKKHPPERIDRYREASSGANNPMFGKTGPLAPNFGRTHSAEARQKMSASMRLAWQRRKSAGYVPSCVCCKCDSCYSREYQQRRRDAKR